MSFKKFGTSVSIVFASAFLTVYSASASFEVDALKTALVAGAIALLPFIKKLLSLYNNDDKLTDKEIDNALSETLNNNEDTL